MMFDKEKKNVLDDLVRDGLKIEIGIWGDNQGEFGNKIRTSLALQIRADPEFQCLVADGSPPG